MQCCKISFFNNKVELIAVTESVFLIFFCGRIRLLEFPVCLSVSLSLSPPPPPPPPPPSLFLPLETHTRHQVWLCTCICHLCSNHLITCGGRHKHFPRQQHPVHLYLNIYKTYNCHAVHPAMHLIQVTEAKHAKLIKDYL